MENAFYKFNSLMKNINFFPFSRTFLSKVSNRKLKNIIDTEGDYPSFNGVSAASITDFKPVIHEKPFFKEMMSEFNKNKVFVDVGGYHGFYSLMAASEGCKAYCFEANLIDCRFINKNIKINGFDDIHLTAGVVGAEEDSFGLKLDNKFEKEEIDILKIDVDGGEIDVLRGATKILSEQSPKVYLETHSGELRKKSLEILEDLGYSIVKNWERGKDEHIILKK